MVSHSHAFHGDQGVELYEVTEGDGAYYYTGKEFEARLNARATAGVPGSGYVILSGAGGRATLNGSVEHTIEGNLLGIYSSGWIAPTADTLTVDRPDGTTQRYTCPGTNSQDPKRTAPAITRCARTRPPPRSTAATTSGPA